MVRVVVVVAAAVVAADRITSNRGNKENAVNAVLVVSAAIDISFASKDLEERGVTVCTQSDNNSWTNE